MLIEREKIDGEVVALCLLRHSNCHLNKHSQTDDKVDSNSRRVNIHGRIMAMVYEAVCLSLKASGGNLEKRVGVTMRRLCEKVSRLL